MDDNGSKTTIDRLKARGFDRRTFLQTTGAGAVAALAGCSSSGSGGSGNGGGSSSNGTTTGTSGGGSSKGKLTVGLIEPLSRDVGKGAARGAEIAIQEINNNGGINGRQVESVKADSKFSASHTNTVVEQFVRNKNVDVLSGLLVSAVMLGIEDHVANLGVPFLSTGDASPKVTQDHMGKNYQKYQNIFRVTPANADFEAKALADYAEFLNNEHGWTKFAVVAEDAGWNKPITNQLPGLLKKKGLEVTMTKRFSPKINDYTPVLDKVKKSGAEAMLKAIAHVSGQSLLSTWSQNKYPFAQEGLNIASMSPHYWQDTNGGCLYEGAMALSPGGVAKITDKTDALVKKYQKKYTSRPSIPMSMGVGSYDAMYMYKKAVEKAGTADYKNNIGKISSAMAGLSHTGASGTIEFFQKGEKYPNGPKYGVDKLPITVNQWQKANGQGYNGAGGKKVCVWPKKYATGKHEKPAWM